MGGSTTSRCILNYLIYISSGVMSKKVVEIIFVCVGGLETDQKSEKNRESQLHYSIMHAR